MAHFNKRILTHPILHQTAVNTENKERVFNRRIKMITKILRLLRIKLILKETRMEMNMMIRIQLRIGLNTKSSSKRRLKTGSQGKISFHTLKEAPVEMINNPWVVLVKNNLKQHLENRNQFLRVKDIVIQIYHLVLKTLETVSTFIFY